ncbi:MAG: M14 family metallopeptidase [Vicinamibacteria bacterium]
MKRLLSVSTLLLGLASFAGAQDVLKVGDVTAARGTKVTGAIHIPDGIDRGLDVPVSVVHGKEPGKILALIAGTHGYEYTSILALQRLLPELDPARMKGSVILVHMANPETFYARRIYTSSDGKNLNRVYPGRKDGTISERIAEAITREVIDQATHLVDMHSGDGNESLRPYSYWMTGNDPKVDAESKEINLAYGLDHIVIDHDRPKDVQDSRYTAMTGVLRGKPSITAESGGLGRTDEASIEIHRKGALSVINHLGIMDAPSARVEAPVWIDKSEVLISPATGVWEPVIDQKDSVVRGSLVGRVKDASGKVLAEVRAPFAGVMLYVVFTPPITKGEPLGFVGHVKPDGP